MSNPLKNSSLSLPDNESIQAVPHIDTVDGLRAGFYFMEGWIKLHRKVRDNWIWQDPVKFQWWIDILLEVNHAETKVPLGYDLIECGIGQSVRSLQGWALRWKVSKDTARNFLKMLQKDKMILLESLQKTTRITVCNYAIYQTVLYDEQTNGKRTANDKQTRSYPNKNDNKEKKDKNEKNINTGDKSPIFKECVTIYFNFYEKLAGIKPAFSGAEGKHLKELLSKIEISMKNSGREISDRSIMDTFLSFLNSLPEFYKNKIDVKILNSNYDGIVANIRKKSGASEKDAWENVTERRKREREAAAANG